MACEFKMIHRVEFADTDLAGLIHFAKYLRFMEVTEHAFFRSLGFSILMWDAFKVGWPRVAVECSFSEPVRFEDELEARLLVREMKSRSITYDFLFRRIKPKPVIEVARGSMTAVCVSRDPATMKMRAVPIPKAIASRIETAPSAKGGAR
ncbi:MAG TPA: thioesterase family protein [Planctomycetota bacterium]|nr:thioesterase family protein [Planctomycetota bacterium]